MGWRNGRPSALNRAGLIPLCLGAAGLAWNLAVHFAPGETVPVSLVPENLISRGPYRFSRNPMYVCEQALLLGWTVYLGSPGLLFGASALGAGMQYVVGREERTLEERFGDSWREYASRVPRWIRPLPWAGAFGTEQSLDTRPGRAWRAVGWCTGRR